MTEPHAATPVVTGLCALREIPDGPPCLRTRGHAGPRSWDPEFLMDAASTTAHPVATAAGLLLAARVVPDDPPPGGEPAAVSGGGMRCTDTHPSRDIQCSRTRGHVGSHSAVGRDSGLVVWPPPCPAVRAFGAWTARCLSPDQHPGDHRSIGPSGGLTQWRDERSAPAANLAVGAPTTRCDTPVSMPGHRCARRAGHANVPDACEASPALANARDACDDAGHGALCGLLDGQHMPCVRPFGHRGGHVSSAADSATRAATALGDAAATARVHSLEHPEAERVAQILAVARTLETDYAARFHQAMAGRVALENLAVLNVPTVPAETVREWLARAHAAETTTYSRLAEIRRAIEALTELMRSDT